MADVVFSDYFANNLKQYYRTYHINRQVIRLPLLLGLGDIAQADLFETRRTLLKIRSAHESGSTIDGWDQAIHDGVSELDEAIGKRETLRIWWTDLPDESCGFAWLCDYLKDQLVSATFVHVPLIFKNYPFEFQLSHFEDASLFDFVYRDCLKTEQLLSRNICLTYSYLWRDLRRDNTPLRIMINGHLMSQPINFYDRFLLSHVTSTHFNRIASVIEKTIEEGPLGVPGWWYRHRIDYLISNRVLWFEASSGRIKLRQT